MRIFVYITIIIGVAAGSLGATQRFAEKNFPPPSPTAMPIPTPAAYSFPVVQSGENYGEGAYYPADTPRPYTVCADHKVEVRGAPSLEVGPLLRYLQPGQIVRVREYSQGWGMIAPAEWVDLVYLCKN